MCKLATLLQRCSVHACNMHMKIKQCRLLASFPENEAMQTSKGLIKTNIKLSNHFCSYAPLPPASGEECNFMQQLLFQSVVLPQAAFSCLHLKKLANKFGASVVCL